LLHGHTLRRSAVDRGDQIVLLYAGFIGRTVGNDILDDDIFSLIVDLDDDAGAPKIASV
jgi:hypothetical protein